MRYSALAATGALLAMGHPAHAETAPLQTLVGADSDLRLSGSVRLRYESLTGQLRPGLNATDEQLALRSILTLEYHTGPLRIVGEVHDSRAWLGKPGSSTSANDVDTFEPMQAYAALDLGPALGKGTKLTLTAGRFLFNLGSRRFVASDDYRNAATSYTGLRSDFRAADGTAASLFYVLPQTHLPDDQASVLDNRFALDRESPALRLFGGLVSRPHTLAGGSVELGYYRLLEKDRPGRPTRDRDLHTFSARLLREPKAGKLDFELEGAWQTGRTSTGTAAGAVRVAVDAGLVHGSLGYTFPGPARLHLTLAADWVEGDRPGGAYNRFDSLYGGRRFEWAPSGIFAAIARANTVAPSIRLEAAPGKRFDVMAVYRPMWLASRTDSFSTTGIVDATGASGSFAGHHLDSRLRYWLVPALLRAEVNYDFVARGRFLTTAPNAPRTGNTHYVTTSLTASF